MVAKEEEREVIRRGRIIFIRVVECSVTVEGIFYTSTILRPKLEYKSL
tara:strand:+ start:285 stop:428 length:144 start_codon:yes stop_codon:yes gene_type:complete